MTNTEADKAQEEIRSLREEIRSLSENYQRRIDFLSASREEAFRVYTDALKREERLEEMLGNEREQFAKYRKLYAIQEVAAESTDDDWI